MVGASPEELVGSPVSDVVDEPVLRETKRLEAELAAGERSAASLEADLKTATGRPVRGEATFALIQTDDGYERVGVVRDVTERREREHELRTRVRQQETVTDLGQQALEADDLDALLSEATDRVASVLEADYCVFTSTRTARS